MILYLIFLSLFSIGNSQIIYPNENSDLYIHDKYNISWKGNLTNYHIYLLHENENLLFASSLSTFENGDLVLDDVLKDNNYEWHIPRDLNYYELEEHSFRIMIANNPMFSSSLSSEDNFFVLSDRFNIITNMNITKPEENYVVIPGRMTAIEWNGFLGDVDIILEYDNNGWKEYGKLENEFSTHHRNEYNWLVPLEINDLSDYKFRIKLEEKKTGIYRYSKNFKSYGIDLIEPKLLQYNFLSRNNNQLNISWIEKNNIYGEEPKIRLLNENNDTLKIFDSNVDGIYNWELENNDYIKNYIIEIENYNITQRSNLFLVNHLTTTLSTTTTNSNTITSTTITNSNTITSNTETYTTITSNIEIGSTITSDSITSTSYTFTNNTSTEKPLIIMDKIPAQNKKKRKLNLIWIIVISLCCLLILILFLVYLKIYNKNMNKICDISENKDENRGIENHMYEKRNNFFYENRYLKNQDYGNFVRYPNPLYNKNENIDHYTYLSRLAHNTTYEDYIPNNTSNI